MCSTCSKCKCRFTKCLCNSLAVARIGDSTDAGGMTSGSGNVFANVLESCINITVMAVYDSQSQSKSTRNSRSLEI